MIYCMIHDVHVGGSCNWSASGGEKKKPVHLTGFRLCVIRVVTVPASFLLSLSTCTSHPHQSHIFKQCPAVMIAPHFWSLNAMLHWSYFFSFFPTTVSWHSNVGFPAWEHCFEPLPPIRGTVGDMFSRWKCLQSWVYLSRISSQWQMIRSG